MSSGRELLHTTKLYKAHIDWQDSDLLTSSTGNKNNGLLESPCSSTNLLKGKKKNWPRNRWKPVYTTEPHQQKDDFVSLLQYQTNVSDLSLNSGAAQRVCFSHK